MQEKHMIDIKLPIWQLQPHPKNVRKDIGDITELTTSIRAQGIMQNLLVVPVPEHEETLDLFWVVIGNRRLAAAEAAGLTELPCVIAEGFTEQEQLELMLVENLQRCDLTPVEEAQAYEQLTLDFGLSAEQIAEKTGVSASTIRRRLKITELDQEELGRKSFQLSLSDYAALEQIKDVQKRNAILGAALNSDNLKYLADRERQEEKAREQILPELTANAERFGIELVEEKKNNFRYVGAFYRGDAPDVIKNRVTMLFADSECDQIYADMSGPTIYLYGHPAKVEEAQEVEKIEEERETQLSREELRRQKRERDHRFMLKVSRAAADDRREFIAGVVDGKFKPEDSEDSRLQKLWTIIRRHGAPLTDEFSLAAYVQHKEKFEVKDEEAKDAADWPTWIQMLAAAGRATDRSDYLCECGGKYSEKAAETLKMLINLLGSMGYSIRDAEQEAVINGTHDCWERE